MGGVNLDRSALATGGHGMLDAMSRDGDVAEQIRAYLAPHHVLFCDRVLSGLKRGDRTALNLYPRLVRAIGADSDLTAVLIAQLGVQSLDAARRIMDLAREANATDSEALYERSMRYVVEYRRRHGMPPMIEGREVKDAAVGETANGHGTNGHANGSASRVPLVRGNGSGPPRSSG